MKRFPDGSVLYDDSPWFIALVLLALTIGFGYACWLQLTDMAPRYLWAALNAVLAAGSLYLMLTRQFRSFYFDPSTATMTWKTRGLFRSAAGRAAFRDIKVGIDTASFSRGMTYRVMLTMPAGAMPLTLEYVRDLKWIEQEASDLRALLGQSADSLQSDSVAQMVQNGNKNGAVAMLRGQGNMTLEDAVQRVNDQGR